MLKATLIPAKAGVQITVSLFILLATATNIANAAKIVLAKPLHPTAITQSKTHQQKLNEARTLVIQHRTYNTTQINKLTSNNILLKNHLDLIGRELTLIVNALKQQQVTTHAHQQAVKTERNKAMKQIKMAGWIIGIGVLFLFAAIYGYSRSAGAERYSPQAHGPSADELSPEFFEPEEPEPSPFERDEDTETLHDTPTETDKYLTVEREEENNNNESEFESPKIGYSFTQSAPEAQEDKQEEDESETEIKTESESEDSSESPTPEDEGEFDYLASSEALPAKLDLARAYIQMEDYATAREVLNDVIKDGDETQRRDAQVLLDDITDL